jgi:hypothetical protein
MDLVALKNEIATDPAGIGYAAAKDDHVAIARLLNKPGRSIDRESLTSGELVSCLDQTEFSALTAPQKAYLNLFVTAGEVPMTQKTRQALRAMFPAGSETRQEINRATKRDASRAEELGFGRVTESDVADALLRT